MTDNDREAYRRSEDGSLTIWGARDVLLDAVKDQMRRFAEFTASGWTLTGLPDAEGLARIERALDDLEEAVIRTHDRFGCPEGVAELELESPTLPRERKREADLAAEERRRPPVAGQAVANPERVRAWARNLVEASGAEGARLEVEEVVVSDVDDDFFDEENS